MKFFRTLWWLYIICIVIAVLLAGYFLWGIFGCEHETLAISSGPGDMDAKAVLETCYSESVYIELDDRTFSKRKIILSYQPGSDKVVMNWVDKDRLDITVPQADSIGLETVQWGTVHIAYHFGQIKYP